MTNPDASSIVPLGSIIADKYRVERIVGKGGMGVVVAVRHIKLDEPYAIKVMLADDLGRVEPVERFRREAKAAVKLKSNEHVARVTDVDTLPNGLPYMVMELLEGQDLDKILKERGVFPFHEACSYVVQACSALVDAHDIGIIHRDLKPQNLFLTHRKDGSPCIKVLDFGISKHTLTDDSSKIDLTQPCDIFGSACYMSPEQARSSKNVVPQSDIWSLGAVLYKLLTGRAPFTRKTVFDVYQALLDATPVPSPALFRPDMPVELERIILRCLDKNIANRYASARELMAALAPFTVPGETKTIDDADTATTLPLGRRPKLPDLGSTIPLARQIAPARAGHAASGNIQEHRGLQFRTQPIDARSLQAALHAYLPPRTIARPPAPSQPILPSSFDEAGDDATPRIVTKAAAKRDSSLHEAEPRRPLPSIANTSADQTVVPRAPDVHGTICVPTVSDILTASSPPVRERLPSRVPDTTMTPWHAFPSTAPAAAKRTKLILLLAGAIALAIVLLVLKLFSTAPNDVPPTPAVSNHP
ncbi:MAG: serine/threonine protein kinase [Polyangiaceae bacterium]|nr:serine/threonine protein kinase [Polyangiaceae bacterium]